MDADTFSRWRFCGLAALFRRFLPFLTVAGVVAGSVAGTSAADDLVPVGVAKIDITPETPIRLAGFNSRRAETTTVESRLWAKALAFGGEGKNAAILITMDMVGVPAEVRDAVAKNLQRRHKIDPAQVVICATHTHSGPYIRGLIPFHFPEPLPADQQARCDAYTKLLIERLTKVAEDALESQAPSKLGYATGKVTFAGNRRVLDGGKWAKIGYYSEGPVDHSLPMLRVTDANGNLRAVLVTYACHCVLNTANVITADWAGAAQSIVEERHPGTVAMVSIGCGADANPIPQGAAAIDDCGRQIADEVDRLLKGDFAAITVPPKGKGKVVNLAYDRLPSPAELAKASGGKLTPQKRAAKTMLEQLQRGKPLPRGISYPVQTLVFGDELAMVFLAGEPVVDYALHLREAIGSDRLWIHGYSNAHPGYIPSKRLYAEGGYEVDNSQLSNGHPSRYSIQTEETILKAVKQLLPKSFINQR